MMLCNFDFVDDVTVYFPMSHMAHGVGSIGVCVVLKHSKLPTYSPGGATLFNFVVVYSGSKLRITGEDLLCCYY